MSVVPHDTMPFCSTFFVCFFFFRLNIISEQGSPLVSPVLLLSCLWGEFVRGQWLRLTAAIRLLRLLLYQYASLSPALVFPQGGGRGGEGGRDIQT